MKKATDLIPEAVDFLTQMNYNHNRKLGVSAKKFGLLYGDKKVAIMEKNFKKMLTIKKR
jgi:hypothetical protein